LEGTTEKQIDKTTLQKVEEIDKMPLQEKTMIYSFLDVFIAKNKMQAISK
jgi:hypothetical protein